ncbi:MAG: hypothetical protein K2G67_07560 [Muribaculaceae bacterium]|nr:hypothetical protein [Muribaculaceae bacterium]
MREAYNLLKDKGRVSDANVFEERIVLWATFNQSQYRVDKQINIFLDEKNKDNDGSKVTV